jgi:hypothetical protein
MYEGRNALGYFCEEVLQGNVKQRGVGFGRRPLATNRKAIVMTKLALQPHDKNGAGRSLSVRFSSLRRGATFSHAPPRMIDLLIGAV